MTPWLPVVSLLVTAILGFATYAFQKIRDRKEDLIKTRRSEYRKWMQALYDAVAAKTTGNPDALNEFNKLTNELFLFGSDDVIRAVGRFKAYVSANAHQDGKVSGELLAEVIKKMRTDCFERTTLSGDEIRSILPLAGAEEIQERPLSKD